MKRSWYHRFLSHRGQRNCQLENGRQILWRKDRRFILGQNGHSSVLRLMILKKHWTRSLFDSPMNRHHEVSTEIFAELPKQNFAFPAAKLYIDTSLLSLCLHEQLYIPHVCRRTTKKSRNRLEDVESIGAMFTQLDFVFICQRMDNFIVVEWLTVHVLVGYRAIHFGTPTVDCEISALSALSRYM